MSIPQWVSEFSFKALRPERPRHVRNPKPAAEATFRIPNISRFREFVRRASLAQFLQRGRSFWFNRARILWQGPWPLTARVPVVSGALILAVAMAISHAMMAIVAGEQELGVRRVAAVYLDGISTTIYPHVLARNLVNTTEALHRTMWFHQSMREQRAIVRLPDGTLFADVSEPDGDASTEDPFHDTSLMQRLEQGNGFVFDTDTGTGWASRAIVRNGNHVADLYVALELKPLIRERHALRRKLVIATIIAGLGAAADRVPDRATHGVAGSFADRAAAPCAGGRL